jgi:uncharacterized membrane protein SirB2
MKEELGSKDGADMDAGTGMDAQSAAVIMQEARERARRELTINHPAIFATWALVYLLGYGTVWLSVRGQQPYHAPAGWALALLVLLAAVALAVTALVRDRAASGVGGMSALKRRIYSLSLAAGLAGVIIMQAALRYDGASRGVIGVFQASAPLLVAGVILVAGTAAWLNWYLFGLGIWLIAVAAFSGFAGPAGVWAVDALAVGIPFLAMAAIRLGRSGS